MRTWIHSMALLPLVACVEQPFDPARGSPGHASLSALEPSSHADGSLVLTVPGQLVTLERGDGQTERAWVQAQMTITIGRDGTPISDGAILVVSAADGPMPQTDPDAETTRIQVRSAGVGGDGTVHFEGTATTTVGREISPPFDVSGTATPTAAPAPPQQVHVELVWDTSWSGNSYPSMTFRTSGTLHSWIPKVSAQPAPATKARGTAPAVVGSEDGGW